MISCHVQWAACLVLRRVVSFLSPSHQSLFTQAHPPSSPSQLLLWAHLDLTVISKPLQTQVMSNTPHDYQYMKMVLSLPLSLPPSLLLPSHPPSLPPSLTSPSLSPSLLPLSRPPSLPPSLLPPSLPPSLPLSQVVQQLMATSIEFISAELPSEHPDLQSLVNHTLSSLDTHPL